MTDAVEPDFDSMSDADFMAQAMPPAPAVVEDPAAAAAAVVEAEVKDEDKVEGDVAVDAKDEDLPASAPDHTTPKQVEAPKAGDPDPAAAAVDPAAPAAGAAPAAVVPTNYEDLYKNIMKPFKANGKEFTPATPEEAVRLMQMGANYTQKMQGLKPNLAYLRMLENNGLLDEAKLSHLIDVAKGDKGAIQKLLADAKVDPLDIDTSAATAYQPGSHKPADAEMNFHSALEDVMATPTGQDTVKVINSTWDKASKDEIYKDPAILSLIDQQRSNGIYAKITTELDRRRVLGELTTVPFLQAYKTVGDALHAQGVLLPKVEPAPAAAAAPAIAPAVQTPELGNRSTRAPIQAPNPASVKALAAAPGSGNKVPRKAFNPLTMSDEEIMAMPSPF